MADICRTCGAPIIWVRTASERMMPVDAEPCADGNVYVARTERGLTAFFSAAAAAAEDCARHKSHFATCPQARTWRKSRGE